MVQYYQYKNKVESSFYDLYINKYFTYQAQHMRSYSQPIQMNEIKKEKKRNK